MAYSIEQHLTYNAWANTKIADLLRTVEDTIYFQDNKSSFPSIATTVLHIWGAQYIWLKRMQGESLSTWPVLDFKDNKNKSLDGLVESSNDIVVYVASRDKSFLTATYAYKNMKGEPFEDPYENTLFHIVNHGTYHRGQITTMLRQAGVTTLASTDLIHYLRGLNK